MSRSKNKTPFSPSQFRSPPRDDGFAVHTDDESEFLCPYCRRPVGLTNVSMDHGNPVSRRGSFALANISTMCQQCNTAKGSLNLVELAWKWDPQGWTELMRRLRSGGGTGRNGGR